MILLIEIFVGGAGDGFNSRFCKGEGVAPHGANLSVVKGYMYDMLHVGTDLADQILVQSASWILANHVYLYHPQ
jgi:hypothetical protein